MKPNLELLAALPKIELHQHLDCSLSFAAVQELQPDTQESDFSSTFVGPKKSTDLADFLGCAQAAIDLLQTERALRLAVIGLFEMLQQDNVIYAEIRFAPLLHIQKTLSAEEVVEIIADSVAACAVDFGIQASLILCTLRHFDEARSMQTVHLAEQYMKRTLVSGIDIASDEAGFPIDAHISAFQYAKTKGLYRIAHAGEAKGPASVWESVREFDAQRIGHGVRSIEDPNLIEYLISKNIHLEICPTSNIQTNVYDSIKNHPVDKLYNAGLSIGINTDSRTLVRATLLQEYQILSENFDWSTEHFYRVTCNALNHAFVSRTEKERLQARVDKEFAPFLSSVSGQARE